MPPAASAFFRSLLPALAVLRIASAAPSVLIDDDFGKADDSLWHFQAKAFTEGVLSPGLEADTRGRTPATGELRIDPSASALRFVPRHGVKAHRSCFLGFRSDFRMDDVFAANVVVDVLGELSNPAGEDSLGGLYILVRYENEVGNSSLVRTTTDIRSPQSVALDTSALMPVYKLDWFSAPPLTGDKLAYARSHITGLGLCYISQRSSSFGSQALLVGGFKARGELRWPPLPGSPEETEIMAGDSVALTWKFPPNLSAEFQWYRNEKPVPSVRGPRYMFRPGQEDARVHVFRADVRLPNGDRISTAQMRVKVLRPAPPQISHQSGDTAVPEGGDAVFRVVASGLQPLTYQWYRNNKPIPGAIGPEYVLVTQASSEGGRYQCEVKDGRGRTTRSRAATLIVKPGTDAEAGMPQGLSVGPKVGLNFSDFYRDPGGPAPSDPKFNFLQAGVSASWQLLPKWAVQADLLFSRKGVVYNFSDHTSAYNLDYLELPLLVRARFGKWMPGFPLSVVAGGYGAYLVNAAREEDWGGWKGSGNIDGLEAFDYGAVAGLSWEFGVLSLDGRYTMGLAPLDANQFAHAPLNGVISIMVGMTLFTALDGPR